MWPGSICRRPRRRTRGSRKLSPAIPPIDWREMLHELPIAQKLADLDFDSAKTDFVADEVAKLSITAPRPVSAADVRSLLAAAY